MDDFEKRAREIAIKFLELSSHDIENDFYYEVPTSVAIEVLIDMAKWARAEMASPIGSDFNEHYKQKLLAEIAQLRDDLKLKERSNKLLRDDNNRLKAELDKAQEGESYYRREFESACERLKYREQELERANALHAERLKLYEDEVDKVQAELANLCDSLLDRDLDWDLMHTKCSMSKLQDIRGKAQELVRAALDESEGEK